MNIFRAMALLGAAAILSSGTAGAAEQMIYALVIKDHKFSPETLEIPTGKQVRIQVDNQDPTPEEFESHELGREKVIPGNSKGVVLVGPLEPGTYPFFGEFNEDTAKGQIVVK